MVAKTTFGDLFLRDEAGAIFWLNTSVGKLSQVASSEAEFRNAAETDEKRTVWFAEQDAQLSAGRGLNPTPSQCIGFSIPTVFAESASSKPYIADLYEYVSFLGDLHRQISSAPDRTKVKPTIQPPKPASRR